MGTEMMHELRDKLCKELGDLSRRGELNLSLIDTVDKLTHSIKSIDTIIAMDSEGYSGEYYRDGGSREGGSRDGGSYSSYARRGRDSMGRYTRSRDGNSEVVDRLEGLIPTASSEREREAIRTAIETISR